MDIWKDLPTLKNLNLLDLEAMLEKYITKEKMLGAAVIEVYISNHFSKNGERIPPQRNMSANIAEEELEEKENIRQVYF